MVRVEVIRDPTCADTILDRLVHNAHRIKLPAAACDAPDRDYPQMIEPQLATRQKSTRRQDASSGDIMSEQRAT